MNRVLWIDLIRVTGAFLVVMSHTCRRIADGFPLNEKGEEIVSLTWLVTECFHALSSSVAVPLFLMVSGSLLLDRTVEVVPFYRKRFGKVLLPFLAWSCVFILCLWFAGRGLKDGTPVTWFSAIGALLSGNVCGHFWFMYMLIALYLIVPFLSVFVRNASKNMLIGFLTLWFVTIVIFPVLNIFAKDTLGIEGIVGSSPPLERGWILYSIGFFVAGYVLKDIVIPKRWAVIAILAWFCLALTQVNTYLRGTYPDSSMSFYLTLLGKYVLLIVGHPITMSFIAFLGLRSLGNIPSSTSRFTQVIVNFAPMTFGIFLCHNLFLIPAMEILVKKFSLGSGESGLIVLFVIPALTVFFYCFSAGLVYVIRRSRYLQALFAP